MRSATQPLNCEGAVNVANRRPDETAKLKTDLYIIARYHWPDVQDV